MMRTTLIAFCLVLLSGCSKPVQFPTVEEFEDNATMRAEWLRKCDKGEYSKLSADETARLCGSAISAANIIIQKKRAEDTERLLNANTRR